jgi:hypothetical protein
MNKFCGRGTFRRYRFRWYSVGRRPQRQIPDLSMAKKVISNSTLCRGEELEKIVNGFFKADAAIIARLRDFLK